jgi:hypothetical protein
MEVSDGLYACSSLKSEGCGPIDVGEVVLPLAEP